MDEADKLFEEGIRGFREQLDEITRACTNTNLRRAMFSATNTPAVSKWCRHNMKGLVTVTVGHRYNKCHVILNLSEFSIKKIKIINSFLLFTIEMQLQIW